MELGDWIALAGALAAIATAIFTGRTVSLLLRQSRISSPTLRYSQLSGDKRIRELNFHLLPEDRERFEIAKLRVVSPWRGRIANAVLAQNSTGEMTAVRPDVWQRSLTYRPGHSPSSVYVDPIGKSKMSIAAYIQLKADPRVKSRFIMHFNIAS